MTLGSRWVTANMTLNTSLGDAKQELTKMVASCEEQLPDYVSIGLNTQLEHMDRVLGGCERIISTPIPLSYTRHTTRSLLLYLLGAPRPSPLTASERDGEGDTRRRRAVNDDRETASLSPRLPGPSCGWPRCFEPTPSSELNSATLIHTSSV